MRAGGLETLETLQTRSLVAKGAPHHDIATVFSGNVPPDSARSTDSQTHALIKRRKSTPLVYRSTVPRVVSLHSVKDSGKIKCLVKSWERYRIDKVAFFLLDKFDIVKEGDRRRKQWISVADKGSECHRFSVFKVHTKDSLQNVNEARETASNESERGPESRERRARDL